MLATLTALMSTAVIQHGLTTEASDVVPLSSKKSLKPNAPSFLQTSGFKNNAADNQGEHVYIVHLEDAPIALYEGNIKQYLGTKPSNEKLQMSSTEVIEYSDYLENKQQQFLSQVRQKVANVKPISRYKVAVNGMALQVSQSKAQAISKLPGVLTVVKERIYTLDTDTGPSLIGAPRVWSGEAQDTGIGNYGEGIVIGIIDTGINTDHPSFADIAGDGYDHTNPLGNNVYLGDCAGAFASLCNDKLIGVYSYDVITSSYSDTDVFPPGLAANGEDYNGHGSHVASTAAGNVLLNVRESLPELNAEESDGIETGLILPRISGVAPRANIVSYQACWIGRQDGDTYSGCPSSAILQSIEDAIQDQVDIINYSISGGGQPWDNSVDQAFLSARNAGIFVATSAGNTGPEASSTVKHAPWYTAVAASEHGRLVSYDKLINNFTGGTSNLGALEGKSNSGGISAPIVYAGDFANPNDPDNDSAQCLEPFPAGTFSGQIVVCDRGTIARVQKAENVSDGGAGGYVLANMEDGNDNLANDQYVVPGIHIQAAQASQLRNWLSTGTNHAATITASSGILIIDPSREDVLGSFSSKGPNSSISTLTPMLGAPGVEIYAAYADQQFGHDGHAPAAGDFNYLQGTSMSSPHVAGAAALVKAIHPNWTPDNIRSALAMTASRTVIKEDGVTAADWFDSGSGRVQVDKAVESGLVMQESGANYEAANPTIGGDPRTLNIPSITDELCIDTCSWTRTFTATKSGTWNVSVENISSGIEISSSPSSFSLAAGESQTITTTINLTNANDPDWKFGAVVLTANGQPDLHIPVSAAVFTGTIPDGVNITANRSADSLLITDIESITQTNFAATTLGFAKATEVVGSIAQDVNRNELFDDLEQGVDLYELNLDSSIIRIVAEITQSTANDVDLYLLFDANENNIPEESEVIEESISFGSVEYLDTTTIQAGKYWVVVHNYQSSEDAQTDTYQLFYAAVDSSTNDLQLEFSTPSSVFTGVEFDLRANWNLADAKLNDRFYGLISYASLEYPDSGNTSLVNITRGEQDVELRSTADFLNVGEPIDFEILVKGTSSPEDRNYDVTLPIPSGFSLDTNSISQGGAISNNEINWNISKLDAVSGNQILGFTLTPQANIREQDLSFFVNSDVTNIQAAQVEASVLSTNIQFNLPPTVTIEGSSNANINIFETQTATITADVLEPNGQDVNIQWRQLSGPSGILNNAQTASVSFIAPAVSSQEVAVLEVSVQDPQGNTASATVNITIANNDAPNVNISAPSSVTGGQSYTVRVNATDPDGDALTITINGQLTASLTRNAPTNSSVLTFNIVVSDGVYQINETVRITVTPAPSSGGGSAGWLVFILLPFVLFRRLVTKSNIM